MGAALLRTNTGKQNRRTHKARATLLPVIVAGRSGGGGTQCNRFGTAEWSWQAAVPPPLPPHLWHVCTSFHECVNRDVGDVPLDRYQDLL